MRKLFMTAVLGVTMWTVGPIQAQETLDTASVPASFRPYVHLLGSAEVIAPASGPNWRAMEIKAYNEDRKKYQELEAMVLKVWPQVQIMTVMLDTLRPTFLAGIDAVPLDTLRAQRKSIQTERDAAKAERRAERKNKNDDATADEAPESSESVEVALGEETTGPDTLRLSGDDCMVALMVQQGYLDLDSLDADGQRLMVQDTAFDGDLGIKEGFLLVHLLDRQNPGMLDFADDYAKAVKLPFWRTIKTFSRLTGYRINKSYDPERYDGRLEHIIRKHGLDRLDLPCSGR